MKLYSRNAILDLSCIQVMGILNVTPDSFFDGGRHNSLVNAIEHANLMIKNGATIIDIGGESTRPGATSVQVDEELTRVIPVIEAISKRFNIWISVDTSKPEVIRASALAGAHIINDVRSLTERGALEAAVETDLPVCLVHTQRQQNNVENKLICKDIFSDVNNFFTKCIERCERAGIKKSKILLDPGFGFGKQLIHNYELLAHLSKFQHFGLPLLIGVSRKSMIGQLLNIEPSERLSGSLGCAVIAAMQGVRIIRVHDVRETVEVIRVVEAVLSARGKKFYE